LIVSTGLANKTGDDSRLSYVCADNVRL
jgi:hypothetical protein